ncbi:hypothetical protein F0Q45_10165 [Mycobacterium simiae]|uniref:Uncharacterized protein n=1 Tax=Mycobacterium simiae TaxID=1784 RepID=A0A5B1BSE7_MYCSI|nr:hypothetical protein F0Q45_10165 [Mycobacterium simiae]
MIESRSATPKPAGQPGNDTDVIRHGLGSRVKLYSAFPYHLVIKFPQFCFEGGSGVSSALHHKPHRVVLRGRPRSDVAGRYCPAM